MLLRKHGISTAVVAAVVVLVVIVAVAGTYYVISSTITPSTSTVTSTALSTITSTSVSTSVSTAVSTSVSTTVSTSVSTATSAGPARGGTIVAEIPCCVDSLDPSVAFADQGGEAVQQVYQGLVAYRPNTTEIIPLLATEYKVSADGLTYSFQLRQNITFSNGDAFNAYVMWYSIYRTALMNQAPASLITGPLNTTSVTAAMLNEFNSTSNIPPASLMQIMENPSGAITVTGPYSMQFHLAAPFAPFLATLTQPNDFAVDPRIVGMHGGVVANQPNSWMVDNAVGTGPFMITSYQPNGQTTYDRNPTYWGGANGAQPTPLLDRVIIKYVPNSLTRLEDLQRGSAQVIYLDYSLVGQVAGQPNVYIPNIGAQPNVAFVSMDTQKFPLNNTLIRQAIQHAVNSTDLLRLYHGLGLGLVGPVPHNVLGYASDLSPYNYNLTLAKQLLAQAGYPNGQGIPPITIVGTSDLPPGPDVALVIQADLANIGIKAQISSLTISQVYNVVTNPKSAQYPDMIFVTWNWFPDPWAFANWWVGPLSYGSANFAWYNNTQVNNLLAAANSAVDQTHRATIYDQVAHLVYTDAPYIWVAQTVNGYPTGGPIVSVKVRGYELNLGFWATDYSLLYYTS